MRILIKKILKEEISIINKQQKLYETVIDDFVGFTKNELG